MNKKNISFVLNLLTRIMNMKKYVEFIFSFYVLSFLVTKVILLVITWNDTSIEYYKMAAMDIQCDISPTSRNLWHTDCIKAKQMINSSPFVNSLYSVMETVNSCGFVSCQDILLSMLNSWAGLIFMVAWSIIFFFIFFTWIENRKMTRDLYRSSAIKDYIPDGSTAIRIEEIQSNGIRRKIPQFLK